MAQVDFAKDPHFSGRLRLTATIRADASKMGVLKIVADVHVK
jgi:hypothetical protein